MSEVSSPERRRWPAEQTHHTGRNEPSVFFQHLLDLIEIVVEAYMINNLRRLPPHQKRGTSTRGERVDVL